MNHDTNARFFYDAETHTTTCERKVRNYIYRGVAKCHPHDYDFETRLVGEHYAYTRSVIQELAAIRDELCHSLKTLRHLYNILEQNPRVDINSVECYIIRRQLKIYESDLKETRALLKETRQDLRDMMAAKDDFYRRARKLRKERDKENAPSET